VLPLLQLSQIDADQPRLHRELFLRETAAGSQSLELFAETLNRAHGTLKRLILRNQPKLFEGCFGVVDDFLGDDVGYDL
jgi:hypothetical protein